MMNAHFGISLPVLSGQLLLGLFYGAFYPLLSLGLVVIFGPLRVINFAHGALCMADAFTVTYASGAMLAAFAGVVSGPTVGVGPIVTVQNDLAISGLPASAILGLLFLFCVLTFRSGIVGEIAKRWSQ